MSKNTLSDIIHYQIPLRGLKFSTNKFYAGTHWSERKQIKDSILSIAGGFCRPVIKVESYPVEIHYRFIFKSRPLDTLNTAIISKMFEDALCSLGILEDDSPKFVGKSILEVVKLSPKKRQEKVNGPRQSTDEKDEDYLEITIKPYEFKQAV